MYLKHAFINLSEKEIFYVQIEYYFWSCFNFSSDMTDI